MVGGTPYVKPWLADSADFRLEACPRWGASSGRGYSSHPAPAYPVAFTRLISVTSSGTAWNRSATSP
jgi:hypothetical protein